jgi:hypothetical protein
MKSFRRTFLMLAAVAAALLTTHLLVSFAGFKEHVALATYIIVGCLLAPVAVVVVNSFTSSEAA